MATSDPFSDGSDEVHQGKGELVGIRGARLLTPRFPVDEGLKANGYRKVRCVGDFSLSRINGTMEVVEWTTTASLDTLLAIAQGLARGNRQLDLRTRKDDSMVCATAADLVKSVRRFVLTKMNSKKAPCLWLRSSLRHSEC